MDEKLVLHWLQRLVWNGVVVADGVIVVGKHIFLRCIVQTCHEVCLDIGYFV